MLTSVWPDLFGLTHPNCFVFWVPSGIWILNIDGLIDRKSQQHINWLSKCPVATFFVLTLSPWELGVGFKVVVHPKSGGCPLPVLVNPMVVELLPDGCACPIEVQSISNGRPSVIRGFSKWDYCASWWCNHVLILMLPASVTGYDLNLMLKGMK